MGIRYKTGPHSFFRGEVLYPPYSIVEVASEKDASKTWKKLDAGAQVVEGVPDADQETSSKALSQLQIEQPKPPEGASKPSVRASDKKTI